MSNRGGNGLSLRGPSKLGACDLDEGALTAAVVGRYDTEDGATGYEAACRILPARRELWKLAEAFLPQQLAEALRGRLAPADQTGRGGVRELRRALAEWLAPHPRCHRCHRPITPETALIACPTAIQKAWRGSGAHPAIIRCKQPPGKPHAYGARAYKPVGKCGTLALFTPVHLDTETAAAQRLLRHGGSHAYDLVVDRDGRILLGVTDPTTNPGAKHPLIVRARATLERRVNAAIRANGRLILKTQLRYFSPKGSTTRADLVQGGAMGCRRALMDFDASLGWTFSTYAVNWIYQGIGEAFARRDLVAVPEWASALRIKVEELGLAPGLLLSALGAVAETRVRRTDCFEAAEVLAEMLAAACADTDPRDSGPDIEGAIREAVAAAANPAKAKTDGGDERARERVAKWVAGILGLDCTGGALVSALRHGVATVVREVGTGERDDAGNGQDDGGSGGPRRDSVHLQTGDEHDAEEAAMDEDEARKQWASLLGGLAALVAKDPEAAEVVRRRHALDGLGDPETLEEIAAVPLRSSGRTLCRESVRKAYVRGVKLLRTLAAQAAPRDAALFTLGEHIDPLTCDDDFGPTPRAPHGPFRPRRATGIVTQFAPERTRDEAPDAVAFGAWVGAMGEVAWMF